MIMKINQKCLMLLAVMLWVSACTEQTWSVAEYRDAQVSGLRVFCEGRERCLADLHEQSRVCEHILENLNPDDMTDQLVMTATMEFTLCMTAGVDERFIARMHELVPVKETGTTIRVGPDLNDPGVLQVSLDAGEIRVADELVDEDRLAQYLKLNQVAQRYHKVALLMNKDDMADVGLMITVMDQLKAAGLEQISVVQQ